MRRVREALALYLAKSGRRRRPAAAFQVLPHAGPAAHAVLPARTLRLVSVARIRHGRDPGELDAVLRSRGGMEPFLGVPAQDVGDEYLGGDPASRAWDAYFLHRHGKPFDQHLLRCPGTAAVLSRLPLTIVRDHAPEVLFSLLAPGTPHQAAPWRDQHAGRDPPPADRAGGRLPTRGGRRGPTPGAKADASPSTTPSCTRPGTAPANCGWSRSRTPGTRT